MYDIITFIFTVIIIVFAEYFYSSRQMNVRYCFLLALLIAVAYGAVSFVTGNPLISCSLCLAVTGLLIIVSRLKEKALGEPLVFSDLMVVLSFIQYPKFYLDAVSIPLRLLILVILGGAVALLIAGMRLAIETRLSGLLFAAIAFLVFLWVTKGLWRQKRLIDPSLISDTKRFGLILTLVLYSLRWKRQGDPDPVTSFDPPELIDADIVCIIQCESFFDPGVIGDDSGAENLPTYRRLMVEADQSGRLLVNHFGAYTMRSEYGVLFGRSEQELGYRRFDPYITAAGEGTYSLASRLSSRFPRRIFVHPHDLAFYNRKCLMPRAGFTQLVGPEAFADESHQTGYVGDEKLARKILELADRSVRERLFIYAVTMENHGPWPAKAPDTPYGSYIRNLRGADAMLKVLDEAWEASDKSVVFVFYGDHRPSISGVVDPNDGRSTSYLVKSYGLPGHRSAIRMDLSPDQLHNMLLDSLRKTQTGLDATG